MEEQDRDELLFDAIRLGHLKEFQELSAPGRLNLWPLQRGLPLALERLDVEMSRYLIENFSFKRNDGSGKSVKPHLFTQSNLSRSGWSFEGETPWAALCRSGKTMKDKRFAAIAKTLVEEESFTDALPFSLRDGELSKGRPIGYAAANGDMELIRLLMGEGGVPANGYSPNSDSKYLSAKPEISPLSLALINGHGSAALELLSKGANPRQDEGTRCKRAAAAFARAGADGGEAALADARLAFRVALKADGWERAAGVLLEEGAVKGSPLDSLPNLEVWLAREALKTERLARPEPEPAAPAPASAPAAAPAAPAPKLSWFARLTQSSKKQAEAAASKAPSPAPAPAPEPEPKAKPARRRESPSLAALAALAEGRAREFAQQAGYLPEPAQSALMFQAWAMAKSAFWRMPMPGGVGEQGRDASLWACFKALAQQAGPQALDSAHPDLGGLSLMALASALGHEDVCACLAECGASKDPDPLLEGVAPLALASRFGHEELALSLLAAGADPMEGFKPSAFELPRRGWAVHEALERGQGRLFERLLEAAPGCAALKNARGEDALAACARRLEQADASQKAEAMKLLALCESALLRAQEAQRPSESAARPNRSL